MPRIIIPMQIADISAFTRNLRSQIGNRDEPPGHVEMLNIVCRAAGFTNYQHFRALEGIPQQPAQAVPEADEDAVLRVIRYFDAQGRLVSWPARRKLQILCLWYLWSAMPARQEFNERQISHFLNGLHLFGDAALLRRDLYATGLVRRTIDGKVYCRIERRPPEELKMLLSRITSAREKAA